MRDSPGAAACAPSGVPAARGWLRARSSRQTRADRSSPPCGGLAFAGHVRGAKLSCVVLVAAGACDPLTQPPAPGAARGRSMSDGGSAKKQKKGGGAQDAVDYLIKPQPPPPPPLDTSKWPLLLTPCHQCVHWRSCRHAMRFSSMCPPPQAVCRAGQRRMRPSRVLGRRDTLGGHAARDHGHEERHRRGEGHLRRVILELSHVSNVLCCDCIGEERGTSSEASSLKKAAYLQA